MPMGDEAIAEAARLVLAGEPVAVPTETVYGLAADATNAEAVARIYAAKGRPSFNPLIVHVPDLDHAERIGRFDEAARALAAKHWPGPLTLVVPLRDDAGIASIVTAGLPTIALRVPSHPAMQALLKACGRPLAAPSANASGLISPTRASHVLASLGGRIPLSHRRRRDPARHRIHHRRRYGRCAAPASPRADRGGRREASGFDRDRGAWPTRQPLCAEASRCGSRPTSAEVDEYLIGFGAVAGDVTLSERGDPVEAAARLFDLLHQADDAPQPRIADRAGPRRRHRRRHPGPTEARRDAAPVKKAPAVARRGLFQLIRLLLDRPSATEPRVRPQEPLQPGQQPALLPVRLRPSVQLEISTATGAASGSSVSVKRIRRQVASSRHSNRRRCRR